MSKNNSLLAVAALCLLVATCAILAAEKKMSVQVKQGDLRAAPSFLSTVVGAVKYTDRLTVLAEQGGWAQVSSEDGSAKGWIHTSALTPKKLVLRSGGGDAQVGASSSEQALATKGFNSQVESQFKSQNRDMDFASVDRMAGIKIAIDEIKAFLKKGGVEPGKGGAK